MRTILSSMAIGLLLAGTGLSADCCTAPGCCEDAKCCQKAGCCRRCGGCERKTCQVECGVTKVKKTVWAVECEEFCPSLPGCKRSCKCGGCEADCGDAACCGDDSCCDPCASLRRPTVPPKCMQSRCRKKLVKKTVTCEVPVYKCVVVCGGCGCAESCCGEEAAPAEESPSDAPALPPPPTLSTWYSRSLKVGR